MAAVNVILRIEGIAQTIFEGEVHTRGHIVSTKSGGEHLCDGTGGGDDTAGPTITSALDDGAIFGGFEWDGTYNEKYRNYFITSIGDRANHPPRYYWGYFLNFTRTPIGGCQQKVQEGDEVLFVFDPPKDPTFLKLTGPTEPQKPGGTVRLQVVNAVTGEPLPKDAYVSVNGVKADENGFVSITLGGAGTRRFKAESYGCVRSNKWTIQVAS